MTDFDFKDRAPTLYKQEYLVTTAELLCPDLTWDSRSAEQPIPLGLNNREQSVFYVVSNVLILKDIVKPLRQKGCDVVNYIHTRRTEMVPWGKLK